MSFSIGVPSLSVAIFEYIPSFLTIFNSVNPVSSVTSRMAVCSNVSSSST